MSLLRQRLSNLIFPKYCYFCLKPQDDAQVCTNCATDLIRIRAPYCSRCGESFDGALSREFECPNCTNLSYAFDFAHSTLLAENRSRELLHAYKYQRKIHLAKDLAQLASEVFIHDQRFTDIKKTAILVPVPLHRKREQWRHFNQALEIARFVARMNRMPMLDLLKRTTNNVNQAKLTRKKRLQNLKGIFKLKTMAQQPKTLDLLKQRPNIILIDDVFTTGATAHECATTLKQHPQIEKVIVLTAVRG